ncbi:TPA: hypothetical protein DCL30_04985 [Candidatus Peribacteria bacterium]|nr:MAG: hypothetical protein A3J91_00990 [Candidatus Peribacteria bacterium RIFOXYC2_FULL_58_10]OGJ84747.1 MAG: hypothetical protein A2529_01180 [Candidatus Peribacteria bacterium RIFOXYD2_FULL_58_15]HAI98857.1 hypothetical protein [Candidatus Peribacteria bacterium]HAS33744.1 hypothetical protein [Candidatus Peribacteria bacterium]
MKLSLRIAILLTILIVSLPINSPVAHAARRSNFYRVGTYDSTLPVKCRINHAKPKVRRHTLPSKPVLQKGSLR